MDMNLLEIIDGVGTEISITNLTAERRSKTDISLIFRLISMFSREEICIWSENNSLDADAVDQHSMIG